MSKLVAELMDSKENCLEVIFMADQNLEEPEIRIDIKDSKGNDIIENLIELQKGEAYHVYKYLEAVFNFK